MQVHDVARLVDIRSGNNVDINSPRWTSQRLSSKRRGWALSRARSTSCGAWSPALDQEWDNVRHGGAPSSYHKLHTDQY